MKRLLSILLCVLLVCCFSAQAVFASVYLPNTMIDDIAYLAGEDYELYTIGYTVCCSSQDDWNLQLEENVEDENSVSYLYSATVKAGSVISAQLNCMSEVNLGIVIVAYDESGTELDRTEKDNNGDEIVDAELTVPKNAKSADMLLLANPVNNNMENWIGFSLQLDLTVDGKEDAAALGSGEEAYASASGNTEDAAIDENTAEDVAEILKDEDIIDWAMEDQEDVDSIGDAIEGVAKTAVKVFIALGAIGVGAIVAIIALVKKKAAKKAIKAGAKAAGKAAQKSAAKATEKASSVESASASDVTQTGSAASGGVGDSYVVTDPATGAQTLYIKDANGDWVSSDGNSILDTDKLSDWQKTRTEDRAWQDKSNENLKNPNKD